MSKLNGDDLAAEFITAARWDGFPPAVREKSKMCLMDNLSATISGAMTRVSAVAADFATEYMQGSESTILLHGVKSTAAGAAFANGCAANGLDTDDGIRYAYGHAGAQLFPAALALTEALHLQGKDLLTALVAGYEIAHRFGRCWHDDHTVYQACGSWGSAACAAAASHLMDLNVEQTKHALGIADYHAPNLPMMRDIADPSMVKHGIGWGALTGITAARLASKGFTGIPSLLSHPKYYEWMKDLGSNFIMVDGVGWKEKGFACCGWAHAAAEAARKTADLHGVNPEEIAAIIINTFHEAAALGTALPGDTEEAQFNLAWPVAAILIDGEIGPAQTLETGLRNEAIRKLAGKVEVTESEKLNELCRLFRKGDPRGRFASEVTLVLHNGVRLESGLTEGVLSYPPKGWDRNRMEEKFLWLVGPVLGTTRAKTLIDTIWHFEKLPDIRDFIALIRNDL